MIPLVSIDGCLEQSSGGGAVCCLTIQQESRENTEQNNSFYNHVCATETNCGSSTPHIQRHFTEETLQVLHPFSSARPDQVHGEIKSTPATFQVLLNTNLFTNIKTKDLFLK